MPRRPEIRVERSRAILDNRPGFRLHAPWGYVSVLEGGGHICELGLNSVPGVNPLWNPPWTTIDPHRYSAQKHRRVYGPAPDGKLLAGIAGHNLCFPHFGPPSAEETAAGLVTHGEAGAMKWKILKNGRASSASDLHYGCTLPASQIRFSRALSLDLSEAVVYCEETAENISRCDRPISWNQHVTFGPPFLECGTTIFDMPATHAKVCPPAYSENIFLEPDAEFTWPDAPGKDGGHSDLRNTPNERFGHYTAQLLDPNLEIAFVSGCNPNQGLLVVYAFRRADFPWVGNWEEHNNRETAPWKGRTLTRGLEFSTTPFAIPLRDSIDQSRLFGQQTYRWLPATAKLSVRFLIMMFAVPKDFAGVKRLEMEKGKARITEAGDRERQLTIPVKAFL